MGKYVILPSSTDLNRGDQALIWETVGIAQKAGCNGTFYILSDNESSSIQSQEIGLQTLFPILKHPSRKFKSKENTEYNIKLILKWGSVALIDFLKSLILFPKLIRPIIIKIMPEREKQTLKILQECDACFVKGGGFIHSAGKITDFYTVYFQLFHILLAQSLGKPVYIMPNSFGPFNGFGVTWLVRKALKKAELVTVRESISKKMLNSIGIDAQLFPDLGFNLEKSKKENSVIKEIRIKYVKRELVAITARPYRFPRSHDPKKNYQDYVDGITKFSIWLYENNYLPVFVEHTLSETTHENDRTAILEIVSGLKNDEFAIISNNEYNCRDLKSLYSKMDYVIGTRFHSVIFSMSEGIPSIAITYGGNKGQGIMQDMGLSEYAIPMNELNFVKLQFTFTSLVTNKEQIKTKLVKYNSQIEKGISQIVKILKEKI